ncbi:MAG TPA: dTDP-4-dehydrorhamnose 3,5-epimerase [Acidimicrobiia bacterium]|nr:dTDP-4-dehydrorhamnose 3,5-epimerase [Acidimicrobiia bacterium]
MAELLPTVIPDVVLVRPRRHRDDRGFFSETFRADWFPELDFVQDNHSYSRRPHTLRGMHYQGPPAAQAKLIRVPRGAIRDVAVDIRRGSPTFLHHVVADLTDDGGEQLLVPEGFAHGFITLQPDTTVLYKVTSYYSQEHERGIAWNDPALGIEWGAIDDPILSDRDSAHPPFDPESTPFGGG